MSQFRSALKQHFVENGINISQLSQQCGVNRTTIQHMIGNSAGYKLPGNDTLRKVLKYLPITPGEKSGIEELFAIEKQGVHNYLSRKYVKRIIEQIASIQDSDGLKHKPLIQRKIDLDSGSGFFLGANAVNSVVYSVCTEEAGEENPHIRLNVPFKYTYLRQILLQQYWERGGDFTIDHLIMFVKSPHTNANPNINLQTLEEISPFVLSMRQKYHINYYYSGLDPENELLLAMPYYLVTLRRLLLLSSDFSSAVLISDEQTINKHKQVFDERFSQASVLIQHFSTPFEVIGAYSQSLSSEKHVFIMESQPCLSKYITEEMLLRAAKKDIVNYEEAASAFLTYRDLCSRVHDTSFFLRDGLESFANNGKISLLPEAYVDAFPVSDRIELLEALYRDLVSGNCKPRMIVATKLSIPPQVNIGLYDNRELMIYLANFDTFHACFIEERSIINSFIDFFESIPVNDLVCSDDETMSAVKYYIDELKKKEGATSLSY